MKKSNASFYGFLAVLLAAASFYFSWKTILPKSEKTQASIAAAQNEIAAGNAKLESLQKVKSDLNQLGDIVDRLFIAVPSDNNAPDLLTELEGLLKGAKVRVPTIQVSDGGTGAASAAGASSGSAVSVAFSVSGSFEQVNGVINALEKDIRFMNLKNVGLSASGDGSINLSLQIEAYKRGTITPAATATGASSVTSPED